MLGHLKKNTLKRLSFSGQIPPCTVYVLTWMWEEYGLKKYSFPASWVYRCKRHRSPWPHGPWPWKRTLHTGASFWNRQTNICWSNVKGKGRVSQWWLKETTPVHDIRPLHSWACGQLHCWPALTSWAATGSRQPHPWTNLGMVRPISFPTFATVFQTFQNPLTIWLALWHLGVHYLFKSKKKSWS